jgi:ABC-type sugar transport system ATPase subunit
MSSPPLIRFSRVTKRFHAVRALTDVSFDIAAGEFHAVCGENGAGKSTLMKILSGVITDYEGTVELEGVPLRLAGPRDAEDRGVSIIHQELNLVADLSASANIFLGRELRTAFGLLDQRRMDREATELLAELECRVPASAPVRSLRIGDQQLVEIAKALSLRSRILIMDEPTSALTEGEVERLFRVIGRLRRQGATILYISHKMDEIFRNADTITVLRDGRVVRTLQRAETSPREVTHLMVGREIESRGRHGVRPRGAEVLRVEGLSLPWRGHPRQWRLKDISFRLHRGEVLGVAGLMGAGRTELLECLAGAAPEPASGEIVFEGRPARFAHPAEALRAGIALVTEDRKRFGIFPQLTVGEHLTLSSLRECVRGGLIRRAAERRQADGEIARLRIKTSGRWAGIQSLSGGNQQKCVIGRALLTRPRLLLLDDPTRGIDVGAKAEIYDLIDALCAEGMAILLTSSELPELISVCDRIIVLCEGTLRGEFARDEFSEAILMETAIASGRLEAPERRE